MSEVTRYVIAPKSLSEAMDLAKMIAASNFCPAQMKGKPGDVILSLQMGAEVGLSPMQALQNIAVINGKPCLYGDGALAVAMSSGAYEYHKEWEEGSLENGDLVAHCLVKRRNSEEYTKSFSIDDAKKANLWGKAGPWSQYPNRMLQMRARAFAIRDQFADALRGINIAEEVRDYQPIESKAVRKLSTISSGPINLSKQLEHQESVVNNETGEIEEKPEDIRFFMDYMSIIKDAKDLELLKESFMKAAKKFRSNTHFIQRLTEAKDEAKARIEMTQELEKATIVEAQDENTINPKGEENV